MTAEGPLVISTSAYEALPHDATDSWRRGSVSAGVQLLLLGAGLGVTGADVALMRTLMWPLEACRAMFREKRHNERG
jgi:hypothetical protein